MGPVWDLVWDLVYSIKYKKFPGSLVCWGAWQSRKVTSGEKEEG